MSIFRVDIFALLEYYLVFILFIQNSSFEYFSFRDYRISYLLLKMKTNVQE